MTLTQLSYVVAVDVYRHFGQAAAHCFVTQPTLSMQIQKLEEELGVKIFDRSKQPVVLTEVGGLIAQQSRNILREANALKQLVDDEQDNLAVDVRLGIIPTLAPYVMPKLFQQIKQHYPDMHLTVRELITDDIVTELKNNELDCGIVVSPLQDAAIKELPLFYEELFVYVSANNALAQKQYVLPNEIDPDQLWLLEEGHCFRSQVLNLCELRKKSDHHFRYATGNLEVLKRMVDSSDGITILPELAMLEIPEQQRRLVKQMQQPVPAREVSLVTHRHYMKKKLLKALKDQIQQLVPPTMLVPDNKRVVEIG